MFRTRVRTLAALALAASLAAACGDDEAITPPPGGLGTPAGVTVTQQSVTTAQISWNAVSSATGYLLERSVAPATAFAAIGGTITATTFDDPTVSNGNSYSYRVRAISASDTSDFSTTVSVTITATGPKEAALSGNITTDRTLFKDTLYTLSGYVKVQNGATLTIEPGTRIVGDTTTTGSSLWILRGAKINAVGTATEPIVFTSARPAGSRAPGDWGGIVIIGNGVINRTGGTILTEGGSAGVAENYAGGTDNADNSGALKYVRIEFAGYDISSGAGQELNSLSSYAVGSGTTYEYIQSVSGLDDSFEWWGGAVDGRYLISYEAGDDHFDWSEGYRGQNQYLIAFQNERLNPVPGSGTFSSDPRGFEGDGCDPGVSGCILTETSASTPYSMPVFANFTLIGASSVAGFPTDGNGMVVRRGSGGFFINGIVARYKGTGINIRDTFTDSLLTGSLDSLNIRNVVLAGNAFDYDSAGGSGKAQASVFAAENHKTAATAAELLTSLNTTGLDWTSAGAAATGGGAIPAGYATGYFGGTMTSTTYLGAGDPGGPKWWQGWSAYLTD